MHNSKYFVPRANHKMIQDEEIGIEGAISNLQKQFTSDKNNDIRLVLYHFHAYTYPGPYIIGPLFSVK